MKNIVIFSGTTEGRLLAESFAAAEIPVTVCVATEYGEEVMEPDPLIVVHKGRMDAASMTEFLQGADLVFDATHPYAVEVTDNIRKACQADGIRYKRIERQTQMNSHDGYAVSHVKSTAEAVQKLESTTGNIFLTTGSKELKDFLNVRDRLYVRVLPSKEAIGICEDCGIEKSHIIAQQGPFTYEENLALIRRYDIGVLVTKNSGRNGGYDEKLRAAETAGIPVITIDRPQASEPKPVSQNRTIYVIGGGCGENTLTLEAAEAIRQADVIISTKRFLDYDIVKNNPCPKYDAYKHEEILDIISRHTGRMVVIFSGDIGFFTGATLLLKALHDSAKVKVYPGISSVSAFSAKIGIPYGGAAIMSFHGIRFDGEKLKKTVSENTVTFVLTSGKSDVIKIMELFPDKCIFIASDLGTDHEWIGVNGDESFCSHFGSLYIAAIVS